jgi:hypothetical protein
MGTWGSSHSVLVLVRGTSVGCHQSDADESSGSAGGRLALPLRSTPPEVEVSTGSCSRVWQVGHLAVRPAELSGARSTEPHVGQATDMDIFDSGTVGMRVRDRHRVSDYFS